MTAPAAPPPVDLPCPECRQRGHRGRAPVGSRRSECGVCNRHGQAVRRVLLRTLVARHPEEAAELRRQAELDLWPQVIEAWLRRPPVEPSPSPVALDHEGMPVPG